MAVDKAVYQAPVGLPALADDAEPVDIEIELPQEEDDEAFGAVEEEETESDFDDNLAEEMDNTDLGVLASELIEAFDQDTNDRREWVQTYIDGLKLLGLKYEERTEPWTGACGVYHPMLTESVVRFQSESIMETFPAAGPVKTQIIGAETPEKTDAAARVREDMNYQLTDVMQEYRPEHEKLLWALPLAGSSFKKVYYDPNKGRQMSMLVTAEDLVVPYGASNLETAERVTHVMRKTANEVRKLQQAGFYRDVDLGEPAHVLDEIEKQKAEDQGISALNDERFRVLEMHVDLDLPGYEDKNDKGKATGIALPYVVTLEKHTREVLSIRRNWYADDPLKSKRQHFVHYTYIPGLGFYGYGLIHLIGGYAKSATMIIRQLVDAGTLSNLPGGLKSKGLRVKGDDTPISPGEFRDVDVPSGTIRDNILPLPYKEPSQVLLTLFQGIVQEGRAFASAGDLKISDMSSQAPVGTTLALLERTLKVMSAVQARLHYAMRQEFKLLKSIIAENAPVEYDYDPETSDRTVRRADYEMVEVLPVSDPNATTMAQKVVQYQAVLQLAQGAPQLYNLPLLHRQMIEVMGIKNASKLIPIEDDQKPIDPVQENQNLLTGGPIKAFIEQDHEAHIAVHMAAMQDPKIMQLLQNNPQAPAIQAAAMAHLNEHIAFAYRRQIEAQLGLPMPSAEEQENMDPQVAAKVAQMAAEAAKRLFQQNTAEAAQAQAQQQAQDPVLQLQMAELEIKKAEQTRKEKQMAIDAAARADELEIQREKIASAERVAGLTTGSQMRMTHLKQQSSDQIEGVRLGIQAGEARTRAQQAAAAVKKAETAQNTPKTSAKTKKEGK